MNDSLESKFQLLNRRRKYKTLTVSESDEF